MTVRAPLLAVLAALAMASGCGSPQVGGAPASSGIAGLAPADAVRLAGQRIAAQPVRFVVGESVTFDTGELRRAGSFDLAQVRPFDISGEGVAESGSRAQVTLHASGASATGGSLTLVTYDGAAWISTDGARFRGIASPADVTGGIVSSSAILDQFLSGLQGTSDAGQSVEAGVVLEDLHTDLDPTAFGGPFTRAYAQAFSAGAADAAAQCGCPLPDDFAKVVAGATYYKAGSLDVYVHQDSGHIDRVVADLSLALDFDRMAQEVGAVCACQLGLPSGSLVTRMKVTMTFQDAGGAVTIHPPHSDPTAPAPHAESGGIAGFTV
jgi:hypothetical protein